MSMLQQILDQMFVDPEILDALDEEQKQILFIKMREEQVKRWKAFEEQCKQEGEPQIRKSRDNSRRVRWLKGADGEVWVWVMGEHKDDLTIEQITEKRALEEARQLAEKEMLESMRLTDDYVPVVGPHEDENTLKEQLSRMEPWNADNKIQESMYEDADTFFDPPSNGNVHWSLYSDPSQKVPLKGILKHTSDRFVTDAGIHGGNEVFNGTNAEQLTTEKKRSINFYTDSPNNSGSVERFHDLPSTSTYNTDLDGNFGGNPSSVNTLGARINDEATVALYGSYNNNSRSPSEPSGSDVQLEIEDVMLNRNVQLQKLATPMKLVEQFPWMSGNYPTCPEALLKNTQFIPAQKTEFGSNTAVEFRSDLRTNIDKELSKRQSEIFEKIKEKQQQFDREAEQEAKHVEQAWEEQERKAREAEAQIRRIAQRAREQHRQQSLRTSSSVLPFLKDTNTSTLREALKSLPRPPKPKSREAIINWFKAEELHRGAGIDPMTNRPAIWFHGIISRSRADELLQNKPSGSFLVRVSERIWGYTVSYVVGDGNVKHFLIEKIPQGYQFLGTNQVVHKHLHELVAFHEISPITSRGNEILRWAVGQADICVPDYADLIPSV